MVKVEFLGPISNEALNVDINNLSQLGEILQKIENVSSWLETCAVAVNDTMVSSKDHVLKDGDRISLLPPVCGG